jgi:hypothetical protein
VEPLRLRYQVLVLNNLRSRIVVETDGQLKTGATSSWRRCWRRGVRPTAPLVAVVAS